MNETQEKVDVEFDPASIKIYEVGFLFAPNFNEDNLRQEVSKIKDLITSKGGDIISEEFPRFKDLAYPMISQVEGKNQTFKSAFFGWIKFEVSVDALASLKSLLENNEDIIRFIIIKTVREDTYTPKEETVSEDVSEEDISSEDEDITEDEDDLDESDLDSDESSLEKEIDKSIDELVNE